MADSEDAGVYRLRSDLALVTTVDFFTPMVDDPYTFGQVAAANAMSDVYAMGGRVVTALNIVTFPLGEMGSEVLTAVLAGGDERVRAGGGVVVGGHTVEDSDLKYGMAVSGLVHPDRIVRNGGAKAGDLVVLTKALGTGIVSTGIKQRKTTQAEEDAVAKSMVELNDTAASLMLRYRVHACTDVTGFGLAGHAAEMVAASSGVKIVFDSTALPLLPGTARLAEAGFTTGGARRNREFLGGRLSLGRDAEPATLEALLDPQTSGGLLMALGPDDAHQLVEALHDRGIRPAIVGEVQAAGPRTRSRVTLK